MVHGLLARFIVRRAARRSAGRVLEEVEAQERLRDRLEQAAGQDLTTGDLPTSGALIPGGAFDDLGDLPF